MLVNLLLVAAGSAVGGTLRYGVALVWARHAAPLPWWTLLVNTAGGVLIGIAATLLADSLRLRLLVITGFCGGFTTFSAFSYETLELLEEGALAWATLNIALNLLLSLGGCLLGSWVATNWLTGSS